MAWRSFKKDLDKTYQKIDKIAKKGKDNFQEYYDYIDNLIINKQYGVLTQVLFIKYDFDYAKYFSVTDIKRASWNQIMFNTRSILQDGVERLLKDNSLYRIGLDVYREDSDPYAEVIDPVGNGDGGELRVVISNDENRGIIRIDVLKQGKDYSTASFVQVTGGDPSATALPYIRGGNVLKVDVTGTGSNHVNNIKVGTIREVDEFINVVNGLAYTDSAFQQDSDNKKTYLIVDKIGSTMSASFSTWNFTLTYDRNLINLYDQAFEYLI
jgi:hypothetical protein